jgi:hypothetical protein
VLQPGDPEWVARYRLLKRLGAGGMGRVFLGQSPGGRLVAVKLIRPELADDSGFRRRFAQEVSAARRVSGIFTAPVVDADPDGPQPWLVTAYVAGPSLSDAVEARGPMPVGSVLTLAAGLAEGLGAVHAAGVVHRDLKPSNVLLAGDGPRIIDFGISRATDSAWLTNVGGMVAGSPGFMSPEQAEGGTVGPPADIFSLGGVLAYAATGLAPFGEGSASALLYRVVHGTAATGYLPAPLRSLVERCLAKEPADRPSTEELLAELGYAEPSRDWLSWPAAVMRPAGQLAPTQLDQAARREAGDHDYISGNAAVRAATVSPKRRRLASGDPVEGDLGDLTLADGNPADGRSAGSRHARVRSADGKPACGDSADGHRADGHRADDRLADRRLASHRPVGRRSAEDSPVPVTTHRSARYRRSSALIGAAVAAVLAAGTAGAVGYVVASDHYQHTARTGSVASPAQIRAGNRSQQSEAGARAQAEGHQTYLVIRNGVIVHARPATADHRARWPWRAPTGRPAGPHGTASQA